MNGFNGSVAAFSTSPVCQGPACVGPMQLAASHDAQIDVVPEDVTTGLRGWPPAVGDGGSGKNQLGFVEGTKAKTFPAPSAATSVAAAQVGVSAPEASELAVSVPAVGLTSTKYNPAGRS